MTDVTEDRGQDGAELPAADEQLLRELTERARGGGLKLTGEGGLLGKLTKMVIEGALEGELDDHLGYARHDPAGRDGGNSRNGYRGKTVLTDTGPVEISVPRDRESSFEPKIVAKRQRRLTGVDDMVISLSAKGLTHGGVHSRGSVMWCQAAAGSGGSQGFPASAPEMASMAVTPWAAAVSR
jgi:putative transposase